MATAAKLGEEITVGGTPVEYQITETAIKLTRPQQEFTIVVTGGNSGTIKFAVGETPPAAQKAWAAASADVQFTIHGVENGVKNIWAVGSGAGQKFTII
jgi:ribosomal protein S11